jgi:hypothetical protein
MNHNRWGQHFGLSCEASVWGEMDEKAGQVRVQSLDWTDTSTRFPAGGYFW